MEINILMRLPSRELYFWDIKVKARQAMMYHQGKRIVTLLIKQLINSEQGFIDVLSTAAF